MRFFVTALAALSALVIMQIPAFAETPTMAEAEQQIEILAAEISECQRVADGAIADANGFEAKLKTAGSAVSAEVRSNVEKYITEARELSARLKACVSQKRQKVADLLALIEFMEIAPGVVESERRRELRARDAALVELGNLSKEVEKLEQSGQTLRQLTDSLYGQLQR